MSFPIGKWVSIHALRNAERPALGDIDTGRELNYAELDDRTTRLASALKMRGVRPGDRVGVFSYNNPAMLEILIATAKLGAITVMVNFRLTAPEVNYILDDAGTDILFTSTPLLDTAAAAAKGTEVREIIALPMAAERLAGEPQPLEDLIAQGDPHELLIDVDADSPAVLMYTSGTTGRPKGAMISHTNLFWIAIYHNSLETGLNKFDSNIVAAPLFHIGALAVYTLPLLYWGGRSYVQESFDTEQWAAGVERYGITKAFAVPTMWVALLHSGALDRHDISSLNMATTGGAACPIPVIKALQAKGMSFSEGFGMTETAATATFLNNDVVLEKAGSVGKPTPHVDLRIVDEQHNDVAVGEVGELILRGPSIITGYWNRPDADAQAFNDGWFYSGDLARQDDEGYYYIVDRKKDMIISGGENVYPIEIEQALFSHDAVADISVIGTPHEKWGETVTAVIILSENAAGATSAAEDESSEEDRRAIAASLNEYARERLAGFKVPRRFAFVTEFPRTATGKVRKVELRTSVSGGLLEL